MVFRFVYYLCILLIKEQAHYNREVSIPISPPITPSKRCVKTKFSYIILCRSITNFSLRYNSNNSNKIFFSRLSFVFILKKYFEQKEYYVSRRKYVLYLALFVTRKKIVPCLCINLYLNTSMQYYYIAKLLFCK